MVGEASMSIGGFAEVILRASATNLRADIPIIRMVVAPTALMDIKVMETTPVVASPIVPIIVEEEKAQVVGPMVSIVPR